MEERRDNSKIILIGGLAILVLIIIGAISWINSSENSSENNSGNTSISEEINPEVISGGCDKLGILVENRQSFSCFDKVNKLVRLYISRSEENVVLNKLDFVLYSSNKIVNYTSNYGLSPGSFYTYNINFAESDLRKIEITPIIQSDYVEETCSKIYINYLQDCVIGTGGVSQEPAAEYYLDKDLNVFLVNETSNSTVNGSSQNLSVNFLSVFGNKPQKKILNFSFSEFGQSGVGIIDEVRHTIIVNLPENISDRKSIPNIIVSANATLEPISGLVRDFSKPLVYTVVAADNSMQDYNIIVNLYSVPFERIVDVVVPVVYVSPVESSNVSHRSIRFNASDKNNISSCVLFLNNNKVVSSVNNSSFELSNLSTGNYSAFVMCTDSAGNNGFSNIVNFSVLAPIIIVSSDPVTPSITTTPVIPIVPVVIVPTIVTEVSGITAGEWTTNLAAAKEMATLNKKFYIINIGNQRDCGYCITAEKDVFSKTEFKAWARQNGIAMVYADSSYLNLEPTKSIYNRYVVSSLGYPQIIIVGYESDTAIGAFSFRANYRINGIKAVVSVPGFIQLIDSYTQKYSSVPAAQTPGTNSPVVDPTTNTTVSTTTSTGSQSVLLPTDGSVITGSYQDFIFPVPVKNPRSIDITAIRFSGTGSCTVYQRRTYTDGATSITDSFSVSTTSKTNTHNMATTKSLSKVEIKTSTACSEKVRVTAITAYEKK